MKLSQCCWLVLLKYERPLKAVRNDDDVLNHLLKCIWVNQRFPCQGWWRVLRNHLGAEIFRTSACFIRIRFVSQHLWEDQIAELKSFLSILLKTKKHERHSVQISLVKEEKQTFHLTQTVDVIAALMIGH